MGTSKEEILNKINNILPLIKSKKANTKVISSFIQIIGSYFISLMRYFGLNEFEIDQQYSEFIYDFIKALPGLKNDLKFNSFLFGFLRNKCKSYIIKRMNEKTILYSEIEILSKNHNNSSSINDFNTKADNNGYDLYNNSISNDETIDPEPISYLNNSSINSSYYNKGNEAESTLENEEFINLIKNAINKIDSKYSECLYLFYYEEMQISEIAQYLDCSESCIKLRLLRGKNKLKKVIEKLMKDSN